MRKAATRRVTQPKALPEAVAIARDSDVASYSWANQRRWLVKPLRKASLDLTGRQLDLVKAVHATGKTNDFVLINGRPLTVGWIVETHRQFSRPGWVARKLAIAIADVLFGDVNPSGKLPVTWPRSVGQVPLYYNHMNTGRPPKRTTATLRNIWMFPGR